MMVSNCRASSVLTICMISSSMLARFSITVVNRSRMYISRPAGSVPSSTNVRFISPLLARNSLRPVFTASDMDSSRALSATRASDERSSSANWPRAFSLTDFSSGNMAVGADTARAPILSFSSFKALLRFADRSASDCGCSAETTSTAYFPAAERWASIS